MNPQQQGKPLEDKRKATNERRNIRKELRQIEKLLYAVLDTDEHAAAEKKLTALQERLDCLEAWKNILPLLE